MAGAVAVSVGKPGKRYNAKMTAYVWFLCLIGGSGGLLLGYDNGVIGKLLSLVVVCGARCYDPQVRVHLCNGVVIARLSIAVLCFAVLSTACSVTRGRLWHSSSSLTLRFGL